MTLQHTASYIVDDVEKYGLAEAILLDKIRYLQKYTKREDGFCWKTAEELKRETGLSKKIQMRAFKHLVEMNIVETKNTYVTGTLKKCKHFKLLIGTPDGQVKNWEKSDSAQRELSDRDKRELSILSGNNTKTIETKQLRQIVPKRAQSSSKEEFFNNFNLTSFIGKHTGLDVVEEYEKAKDWLLANGKTYKDYSAFFRNWLRSAKKYAPANKGTGVFMAVDSLKAKKQRKGAKNEEEERKSTCRNLKTLGRVNQFH